MLKSKAKCENLTKNNILCRASLRGLKKCTSCGYINGQRALICRNVNCDLRIRRLAAIKPFDPIELVTYGRTKLYSLRSKEKLLQPRNFVSVTETYTATEGHPTAVCYVDNCKYDALDPAHLVCRHIKACKVLTSVAQAEIYPIDKSVLWNLNISNEQKQHLWQLYQMEEHVIHPIQKLNSSIFVVKCEESKMFPAGRLHVTVFSDIVPNKGGDFSCSCKKLKIILEPDNSVTMKQEICDHLLLLLAAILNKPEGKSLYGRFLDSLQYLWMPTSLNTPIIECESRSTPFMDYDDKTTTTNIKIEHNLDTHNTDDIFNFTEELFAENNIPDFSDIILDVKTEKISIEEQLKKPLDLLNGEINLKDPKLNAISTSIKDEDLDLNFTQITPVTTASNLVAKVEEDFNGNGLSVIEQFQLNHNMQVSSDNIELAKDIENLNNLESQAFETAHINLDQQKSLLKTSLVTNNSNNNNNHNNTEELKQTVCGPVNTSNVTPANIVPVQRSIVLKQGPVKIIKIATPVTGSSIKKLMPDNNHNNNINNINNINNRIIQLTKINPNKIIVLKSNPIVSQNKPIINYNIATLEDNQQQTNNNNNNNNTVVPTLSYESWLDHVIEILNDSITVQDGNSIRNTFHVPEAIFNHFSKSFTLNNKRRLPNTTTVIKSGKYKDHIKYIWYFNQATTVQRIFSSKNFKIELERSFQRLSDNNFSVYKPEIITLTENNNYRPIYPKLQLYKVFVQFSNTQDLYLNNNVSASKCGFKLEWLPSAFPKSNFGLMFIEFCVSVKEPDSL